MTIEILIKFGVAILFIGMALMAKYAYNDGWSSIKKYWLHLLIQLITCYLFGGSLRYLSCGPQAGRLAAAACGSGEILCNKIKFC